jgi:hypothetical protein
MDWVRDMDGAARAADLDRECWDDREADDSGDAVRGR